MDEQLRSKSASMEKKGDISPEKLLASIQNVLKDTNRVDSKGAIDSTAVYKALLTPDNLELLKKDKDLSEKAFSLIKNVTGEDLKRPDLFLDEVPTSNEVKGKLQRAKIAQKQAYENLQKSTKKKLELLEKQAARLEAVKAEDEEDKRQEVLTIANLLIKLESHIQEDPSLVCPNEELVAPYIDELKAYVRPEMTSRQVKTKARELVGKDFNEKRALRKIEREKIRKAEEREIELASKAHEERFKANLDVNAAANGISDKVAGDDGKSARAPPADTNGIARDEDDSGDAIKQTLEGLFGQANPGGGDAQGMADILSMLASSADGTSGDLGSMLKPGKPSRVVSLLSGILPYGSSLVLFEQIMRMGLEAASSDAGKQIIKIYKNDLKSAPNTFKNRWTQRLVGCLDDAAGLGEYNNESGWLDPVTLLHMMGSIGNGFVEELYIQYKKHQKPASYAVYTSIVAYTLFKYSDQLLSLVGV